MSRIKKNEVYLSATESEDLLKALIHPNFETINKRNRFIKNFDNIIVNKSKNGGVSFYFPDINFNPKTYV